MRGDLHCHTKLSDGSLGIDDIIVLAEKCGVDTLAITDIDCLAGTVRAKLIGERHGIKVIQGVEGKQNGRGIGHRRRLHRAVDTPDKIGVRQIVEHHHKRTEHRGDGELRHRLWDGFCFKKLCFSGV